ncbi:Snakin-1 [Sesamum angolense]|uniref:Snakin-1 n=1 Tax=Sesamum angolense TaxID=2727404 RepID=A0AAE1WY08_9LAMI|nr:Snakin-1 [Sesamum angolense]
MKSRLFVACLLLFAILLTIHPTIAYSGDYCKRGCESRCAVAGVKDRCLKYCGICCAKCKCVPAGTYGNKHQCPCYRDMRNSKGTPKCP